MVVTMGALYIMGAIATLATIGIFKDFGDDETRVIVGFGGAITWALFALSSFDVIVDDAASVSEPIMPLFYLGFGFAMVTALFAIKILFDVIRGETESANFEELR